MRNKLMKYGIILLSTTLVITLAVVLLNSNKSKFIERPKYDKTGFVKTEDLAEDKKFKMNNNRFEFELDAKSSQFFIKDKITNQIWNSSVESFDTQSYNELFTVYYETKTEGQKGLSVYSESIQQGKMNYRFKDNILEVLFEVGGKKNLTFLDLPRIVPVDKYNNLIIAPLEELAKTDSFIKSELSFLKSNYVFRKEDNYYTLKQQTSQNSINDLYNLIFNYSNYTYEDYLEDSERYNLQTSEALPYFEFSVKYELTEKGLRVELVNESIVETKDYLLAYIDVLPYFGAGNVNDTGFTVIPDGTGVYIDHNNGRYASTVYSKRVYGNDLTLESPLKNQPIASSDIKLPMYAYSKNNFGFINTIEQGDEMTALRAGFRTSGPNFNHTNKIPYAYYRYVIRERDAYIFKGQSNLEYNVSMWTNDYNTESFITHYMFIEDGSNYSNFAMYYKEYLEEMFNFNKSLSENIMHITFLGGYKVKKRFLGIPYEVVKPLTRSTDIIEIVEELDLESKYSVSYQGWSNNGIKPTAMSDIDFNNKVTTKKQLKNMIKYLKDNNIDLFLEFYVNSAYTDSNIRVSKDVKQTILKNPVEYHKYDLVSGEANYKTFSNYQLNMNKTNKTYKNALKFANKYGLDNLGFADAGSSIASDYSSKNSVFRNQVVNNFNNNMNNIADKNIMLRNANLYGLLNANIVLDLPTQSINHTIVDYSIPFVQLVLNGLVDYYGSSINLDTSRSVEYHKLKAIETGSKVQFTLTQNDTVVLINTEYTNYFSTHYINWLDEIKRVYTDLEELGIYEAKIIDHKVLSSDGLIVKVAYDNGNEYTINYLDETIVQTGGIK